ncbi:hypothetical protein M569_01735, partial [Genlisea aurea]
KNIAVVRSLYDAVSNSDDVRISAIVVDDLDWWFHGPQNCHFMMNALTGKSSTTAPRFKFEPKSIDAIGNRVIVEGWEGAKVYWVHVWTLRGGKIGQFREYFNTWVTVRDFRRRNFDHCRESSTDSHTLWQSHPRDLAKRSFPGLMLAI